MVAPPPGGPPGGYPPGGGYAPPGGHGGGYPPAPGGYPPAPGGYPTAPGGYPPAPGAPGGYPTVPGAPPGYGAYAPAPHAMPRPAQKSGPNIGLIIALGCGGLLVVSVLIGVVVFAVAGSSSSDEPTAKEDTPVATPEPAAPQEEWIESRRPDLKFLKPPGWNQTESGRWGVFKSPDGDAVLAFVGFNQPGESTALIGQAALVLGVNQVVWQSSNPGVVGRDSFPANIGKGICNFKGAGFISYATVNPGGVDQLLIIYTVSAAGSQQHQAAVDTSVKSIRPL